MNKSEMIIRALTLADLEALQLISKETFDDAFAAANTEENMRLYHKEAFSREQLLKELNDSESYFYFAISVDEVIGYLKLNTGNAQGDLKDKNSLELSRIYVRKKFQGQGIGEKMLLKTIEIAKQKKVEFIWLGVWEKNPGAIRFYERIGFEKFSTHSFMLGKDLQTDILMKIVL